MLPRSAAGPALFSAAVVEAGTILLSASGIDGQGHLSPTYAATNQVSSGDRSPMLTLGLLIHTSTNRFGSIVLPRQDAGTALLSDAANKGLGWVPHLLQMMRCERTKESPSHSCHHMAYERDWPVLPFSCLVNRVSSIVQLRRVIRSSTLSISVSEGLVL